MENLDYLNTKFNHIVITKDDLLKIVDMTNRLIQVSSTLTETNSITFIPEWDKGALTLAVSNTLTFFRGTVELLGNENTGIKTCFSIKYEILNKLRPYLLDKILIYENEGNFYIRLQNGDLLLTVNFIEPKVVSFTKSIKSLIFEIKASKFIQLLNQYKQIADSKSDNWISFDTEKLSLCGLNSYTETILQTPRLCLLLSDVDLISKIGSYFKDSQVEVFDTDIDSIPIIHIRIGTVEIEIVNVLSNINTSNIEVLSKLLEEPHFVLQKSEISKVLSLGMSLPNIQEDCIIRYRRQKLSIILRGDRGDSEFNLTLLGKKEIPDIQVSIGISQINKIINSFSQETIQLALYKVYTMIYSDDTKSLILNKGD